MTHDHINISTILMGSGYKILMIIAAGNVRRVFIRSIMVWS